MNERSNDGTPQTQPSERQPAAAGIPAGSPPLERRVAFETVGRRLFGRGSHPVMLGRFVLLGTLGRGGMGTVFKAYDETLDRAIAIKLLHAETSERHAERLRREAQALAKLSHPHVVHVYEVGRADGRWFIAMELISGQTLRQWHSGPHGWKERVRMYLQAGAGLAAAHAVGLVHRDFKPDNCIVDERGRLRVLDFGLARDATEPSQEPPSTEHSRDGDAQHPLTRTGAVLGTLGYMPLEQLRGQAVDARSDQFSFCVSLHEALYGDRPFAGESASELSASMTSGEPPPAPRGATVPARLRRVLLRGLSADPQQRWPSMDALLEQLRRQVDPRRRGLWALGIAGGLAAAGAGLARYAEVGFRCQGAHAQLDGIWDEARRQEVEAAILGTQVSYARDTWERVEPALDEYAQGWASKHTEVCEATSVRQEQSTEVMDLRMECLRGRRIALREAVQVLAEADATRVEHAVELAASLPGLSRCDDVEALRAELPPPEDPAVAEQVGRQREQLRTAEALEAAGEYDQGLAVVEEIVAHAEAVDYAPLLAEALFRRGSIHGRAGRYVEAEQDMHRAYVLAAEHGHDTAEVDAATGLTFILGARLQRHEEGLWWGTTALALARGRHIEPEVEGLVLEYTGSVLQAQGKLDEALSYCQRSLAYRERVLGPEHPHITKSLRCIGLAVYAQSKLDEALTYFHRTLAFGEQRLGPRHPELAAAHHNIGVALRMQGKPQEALERFQRSLAIKTQTLDPDHPSIAETLTTIGLVLRDQGELEQALTPLGRALTIFEKSLGPDHPDLTMALNNLGIVRLEQGELDQALAHFERALAVREQALGPDHQDVARPLNNIGLVLKRQGKLEEALVHFERAQGIFEKALGPDHPDVTIALNNIGEILKEQGKLEEALAAHRRSLAINEQALGPEHREIAVSLTQVGADLKDMGALEDARASYERALAMGEKVLGPRHHVLVFSLWGLAEVALMQDDLDRAREHAERAVSIAESAESTTPVVLATARFTLARALWHEPEQRARARELARQARDVFVELGSSAQQELTQLDAWLAAR